MDDVLEFQPDLGARTISAAWLYQVLRVRLGCVDMGWRDETEWVWVTPNGFAFRVAVPAADTTDAPERELSFPSGYARDLIGRIRDLLKR